MRKAPRTTPHAGSRVPSEEGASTGLGSAVKVGLGPPARPWRLDAGASERDTRVAVKVAVEVGMGNGVLVAVDMEAGCGVLVAVNVGPGDGVPVAAYVALGVAVALGIRLAVG